MAKKKFILSDDSVNRYGYRVKTSGIRLEGFRKNPVCLYNHDSWSSMPVGRWEDLEVVENRLIGTPIFDEADETSKVVAAKVASGTLNAASLGFMVHAYSLDPVPTPEDPDRQILTVTDCELYEVSIVAVPGNSNAVGLRFAAGLHPFALTAPPEPVTNPLNFMNLSFKKGWAAILALVGIAAENMPVQDQHMEQLNATLADRNEQIVRLNAQKDKLEAQAGQATTLQARVTELESQLAAAQKESTDTKGQLSTAQGEVTTLKAEKERLENQILSMQGNPVKTGTDADPGAPKPVKLNYE